MTVDKTDLQFLRRCIDLAGVARARGDEPFGSVLVSGAGEMLAEDSNAVVTTGDVTAHPELALAGWASVNLDADQRAAATMYTNCEQCAMCAGGHYWAGIGRVVFALSSEQLDDHLPSGTSTLAMSSREVFARGSAAVVVDGPVAEVESEARAVVAGYWG